MRRRRGQLVHIVIVCDRGFIRFRLEPPQNPFIEQVAFFARKLDLRIVAHRQDMHAERLAQHWRSVRSTTARPCIAWATSR